MFQNQTLTQMQNPSFNEICQMLSNLETISSAYIVKNFSQSYTDLEMKIILMIHSYSELLLKEVDEQVQKHPDNVLQLYS